MYTIKLSGVIQNTTKTQLSRIIGRGAVEGLSTDEVARQIRTDIADFKVTAARADMIARTEVATLHEESRLQAWENSDGLVVGKQWILAASACDFCAALAAEHPKAIPLSENFYSIGDTVKSRSGETMLINYRDIKTAPLHPNCRCGTIEMIRDEPNE